MHLWSPKWWKRRRLRQAAAAAAARPVLEKEDRQAWQLRRWDSADTHRLNRAHWQMAFGQTINEDLLARLETLRIRAEYEIANNPILEGIVNTYAQDVVGQHGPRLQVHSDDTQFNTLVEEAWHEYAERPDPTREMSLADVLKVDIRSLFSAGEYLHQFTSTPREGPFEFAIRSIHPRRLESPLDRVGDPRMFMGLELSDDGRVLRYWFRDEPLGAYAHRSLAWRPVDAQNIQHRFMVHEQDQLRGFPWCACALDSIADVRDLDKHVLEAERNAAAQSIYWWTNHPEAMIDFQVVNDTRKLEPGMEQTGPPGYQPAMLSPVQPSGQYKPMRHERLREWGRPIGMPLMMILLSSEGNSFSGANHDGQIYIRGVQGTQAWMATGTLAPQCRQIATEITIRTRVRRPRRVEYAWTWPVPPHPDPRKNYEALRMQLEDGAIALDEVCAALGRDFETVQSARDYVNEVLDELDLPRPPINVGSAVRPSGVLREVAEALDAESNQKDATDVESEQLQPA